MVVLSPKRSIYYLKTNKKQKQKQKQTKTKTKKTKNKRNITIDSTTFLWSYEI